MSALRDRRWTDEEYLAFERTSEEKHEFVDGEVYLMTGASRQHNLISLNAASSLHGQLRQRPCEIYAGAMRVRVYKRDYVYQRLEHDEWLLRDVVGVDAVLELTSIGCALALDDVYEKVSFDEDDPPSQIIDG